MDGWDKPAQDHRYRHRRENPSFSSTLLDAIYRSIDEGGGEGVAARRKNGGERDEEMAAFRRAFAAEKWAGEKAIQRRRSAADFERKREFMLMNLSSSSSDSSCCGGGFSSSESETFYVGGRASSCYSMRRPKPIRTRPELEAPPQKPKQEGGGFVKTKSKALKIYGDLKKVKQPISPGGRLASFLNSLFTAGNARKQTKVSTSRERRGFDVDASSDMKSSKSTCSSASSFSRSCLSKTPSSRPNGGAKRSVRFYPFSVILDEDSRPCGHKTLCEDPPSLVSNSINRNHLNQDSEEEDDDDTASCSSSDLFELDNLSTIGIERYREELPVYETTRLDTNRAIANRLIL